MESIKCPRPGCEGHLVPKPKQKQLGKVEALKSQRIDEFGLNPKQNAFVREYIKDYCGAKSAIRAGYSKKAAKEIAYDLLTKTHIQDAVTREERKLQNRFYSSKEKILKEMALLGYSDLAEYVDIVEPKDVHELPPQISRALKEIRKKTITRRLGDATETTTTMDIKTHDKMPALLAMGKEIGMFKDKCEITGKDGGNIKYQDMTDGEIIRLIAETRDFIERAGQEKESTRKPA
jgi:phage terminase small subunit